MRNEEKRQDEPGKRHQYLEKTNPKSLSKDTKNTHHMQASQINKYPPQGRIPPQTQDAATPAGEKTIFQANAELARLKAVIGTSRREDQVLVEYMCNH